MLNEEGVYRIYDLQGEYQQYSLGSEAGELGIIDARIHETGLVALTGSLTFLEVKEWAGGKPLTLANPGTSILSCLPSPMHAYEPYGRPVASTTIMDRHPAGPDHLATCRSPTLRRVNNIQRRQPGEPRPTHIPRPLHTHVAFPER